MPKSKSEIAALIKSKQQGICVDLGGGQYPQPGFLNLDMRDVRGVDIVHNLTMFPWPLPDECASIVMASHLVEHLSPLPADPRLVALVELLVRKKVLKASEVREAIGEVDGTPTFIRFMDEVWRIMKPGGKFMMVTPYGGSFGWWQDPTHIKGYNEATWAYFDPMIPLDRNQPSLGGLWNIYEPKPWKIEVNTWHANGNMEIVLVKRPIQKRYLYPDNTVPPFAGEKVQINYDEQKPSHSLSKKTNEKS